MRATGEETLTFHHKSVPDWLTTHLDTNAFAVGPTKGRKRLAEFCRDSLAASSAKPGWYVRRHAVEHFLEVADWDSATEALCDLEFIEARAIAQELPAMLMDYAQAAKLLPEGEKERQTEAARQAELDRYAREMVTYAAAWSRIRDGSKEKEPSLPRPVKSVQLWTMEEVEAERKRMTETPNRLDRVKAFRVFVATNTQPLQQHATQKCFAANLARNDAPAGPVHEGGKRLLESINRIKIIEEFGCADTAKILPACKSIWEHHKGIVNSVAVSLDGYRLISGSSDKTILAWDFKSGLVCKTLRGHTRGVTSLALSADGLIAVSGSRDTTIRVWDLKSGECLHILEGHRDWVRSVAVSADGRFAFSGGKDKTARLWDLKSRTCIKVLNGHTEDIHSVAMSSNGRLAVSGSDDFTLRVWDLESKDCIEVLELPIAWRQSVAISSDGRYIISGGDGTFLCVLDLETGNIIKTIDEHASRISSVALSPDGRFAFSGSYDRTLRMWDLNYVQSATSTGGLNRAVRSIALSLDGKFAISGSSYKSLRLFSIKSGKAPNQFEQPTAIHHHVDCLAFSADGRLVITGADDNTVRLWELVSRKCIKVLSGHSDCVRSVAMSVDGRRVISGGDDFTLRIWDLNSGKCLNVIDAHKGGINSVSICMDGRRAISSSNDLTMRLWNLESGECIKTFNGQFELCESVTLSPDGRMAVSGDSDSIIRVWDLNNGECIKKLIGHAGPVDSIALSSDGRLVVSGSRDRTVRIWDIQSGHCLTRYFIRRMEKIVLHPTLRNMAVSTANGCPRFFELENLPLGPLITTAHREIISEDLPSGPVTARPPCCGQLISIPANLAERIEHWHLAGDERGDTGYTDPALLLNCNSCGTPLRMNPFFLDVKPLSA